MSSPPKTAAGKGSCPPTPPRCRSTNPARRGDGSGSPSTKLPPEYTKAPGRPPPGRRHRQLLSARGFSLPSLTPSRRSGSGFGHRTPERRRPRRSRPEPRTLCAETKTRLRPPLPLLPRPGTPRSLSGARSRLFRSEPGGGGRRCPAERDSPAEGEATNPPFIPNSTGARGAVLLPAFSPPLAGGAQPRSGAAAARVAARPGGPTPEPRGLRRRARRALPGKGWSRTRRTDTPPAAPPVLARRELPLKEILIFQPSWSWRKASEREPSIQRGAAPCQQPPAAAAAPQPRRARFHGALTLKPTEGG